MVVARAVRRRVQELLFKGYRISVLIDEKNSGNRLPNNVNLLNTSETHTWKWLRGWKLWYVYQERILANYGSNHLATYKFIK